MDVRMPLCDGVQATREIHEHYPWIRILVLTTFDDDEYILQSLQVGALGYLLKRTPSKEIAAAIRSVAQGYGQLGPTIALKVFSQLKSSAPSSYSYQDVLSKKILSTSFVSQELRPAITPPSTSHTAPVTQTARSDNKKAIAFATSVG